MTYAIEKAMAGSDAVDGERRYLSRQRSILERIPAGWNVICNRGQRQPVAVGPAYGSADLNMVAVFQIACDYNSELMMIGSTCERIHQLGTFPRRRHDQTPCSYGRPVGLTLEGRNIREALAT